MKTLQIQQKVFLFSAMIWGVLTVFITPPFQVPDEPNHFFRAYQIANGKIFPETDHNQVGGFIPISMLHTCGMFVDISFHPERKIKSENIRRSLGIQLNPEKKNFAVFPNTGLYSPIPYIPQSLVMIIGKFFNSPPLVMLYSGRLFNLFCWIILISLAIGITPICKWVFVILALLPMSIFQASSLSADVFTNGLAFLLTAAVFRLAFDPGKRITGMDIGLIILLSALLSLSKSAYFFLILIVFLIPASKFISVRAYIHTLLLVFSATGIAMLAGGFFVRHVFQTIDVTRGLYIYAPGSPQNVNPSVQLAFILSHGMFYAQTLVHTLWILKTDLGISFIGNLGWLDTPLPVFYYIGALAILILAAFGDGNEHITISIKKKLVLLFSLSSVVFVLCTVMYMSWTPIGESYISGLQGRYFIPVGPVAFALFYNRNLKFPENMKRIGSIVFIVISFLVMNYSLISRYYPGGI